MNGMNCYILCNFQLLAMFNTTVGAGARAASSYSSGSDQMMRLQFRLRNTAFFGFKKIFSRKLNSFLQQFLLKICVFVLAKMLRDFCEHFRLFSFPRKFSRNSEFFVFAKISRYFRENYTRFSRKFSRKQNIFTKRNFVKFCENLPIFA
jgi:hypothetical protein